MNKPNLKQILSDMEEGKIVSKAFVKEALEYAVGLEDGVQPVAQQIDFSRLNQGDDAITDLAELLAQAAAELSNTAYEHQGRMGEKLGHWAAVIGNASLG